MPYRYKGVECDTLEELSKLKAQEDAAKITQAVRVEHAEAKERKQVRPAQVKQKREVGQVPYTGGCYNGRCNGPNCMRCNKDY